MPIINVANKEPRISVAEIARASTDKNDQAMEADKHKIYTSTSIHLIH